MHIYTYIYIYMHICIYINDKQYHKMFVFEYIATSTKNNHEMFISFLSEISLIIFQKQMLF
jgi:hypothetical protein